MKFHEKVGKRIEQLCNERQISVTKLCNQSGVTPSTVTSIFYGRSKNPGTFTVKKLCDALGITLSEFFKSEMFAHGNNDT